MTSVNPEPNNFVQPELAGYEPHDERPSRFKRRQRILRVAVVAGIIGLVLPGILVTANTAERTANQACAMHTQYSAPDSIGFSARFELFSDAGAGWNCYAVAFGGESTLLHNMGVIPGLPAFPSQRPTGS